MKLSKIIRKSTAAIIAVMLPIVILGGCGNTAGGGQTEPPAPNTAGVNTDSTGEGLNIICTIFPKYDWTRQVLGEQADNVNLTLLMDNLVDLHSYQPTVHDMVKISEADLFIYVGGESDAWVEGALKNAKPDVRTVNMMEILGDRVKIEELTEGMEHTHDHDDDDHDHDDEDDDHDHDDEEDEYDEHVWLSFRNAQILTLAITEVLCELDPDNCEYYLDNANGYIEKLYALDDEYKAAVAAAEINTLLFGDRFPFRYLVDDYGIEYYAAFAGCSAETEASFETVVFLANKLDELGLQYVMTTESCDGSIANTIIQSSNDKNRTILALNSMQSVTANDVANGVTYLSIMEGNLEVLGEALSEGSGVRNEE